MGMTHSHDSAPNDGGSGCTDAGDGTCRDCGVALIACDGVPDYRLIDFGKGVPFFIAFVDELVDGSFDLALDTRTPEGAVLLETLMAKASLVVRGFR